VGAGAASQHDVATHIAAGQFGFAEPWFEHNFQNFE
jgi:hypothetical protein